eukprot:6148960-Pleurochrysis_carterae.AAC.1
MAEKPLPPDVNEGVSKSDGASRSLHASYHALDKHTSSSIVAFARPGDVKRGEAEQRALRSRKRSHPVEKVSLNVPC